MKERKNAPKFTKGTDPQVTDLLTFLLDDNLATPLFLPLWEKDVQLTSAVVEAAIINDQIPISEYIKKQVYYKSFMTFYKCIKAQPAMLKKEIHNCYE